ncbi:hypothetical protein TTHERM_01001560 (macronuclear) [Tetrahymena thermophila SB210]|uniref:Uncharacterized protein n=1 Tax=Tetrahymena thermophila (strain SB210) TaxID=312017 RepID=Q24HG8_TETTS|nr:hypothetical protein TTHERM_01001560 [Tetrahymena thermophila SB210]EAS07263.2 hypothetical protein TTHERM_01001560 [Tetrahymena thermophila SB210]|eukprot:XP_001027505.2 hypothetical protein TTHERM_01001560 [Tetrahymena thermophila SB210]
MYCFKKIAESLFYKQVIEGNFSGQAQNSREFLCVNDTSIHLYSVLNKNIEKVSKYEVNCIIKSAEVYKNQKDEDYVLLTTLADSLLMLGYNKLNQSFQVLAHFCYSHINDKQPPIHQIGKHICVLGDKQKVVLLGAYMKNILALEYVNGTFIQRSIIRLPNDNIHKIFASDEKNTQIENFNILSSELDTQESLKIRIVNVKLNSSNLQLMEKKEIIHVPNLKNEDRQIEVPIDCTLFIDKQGHQNFLILTNLQIINIKLNREATRNKEESTLLKNLFQKDRKQIQPLCIKEFKQTIYILFNDGKCFYFDSFQDNLQEIKKQGFKSLFYADQNEFEVIDALPPNQHNNEWISLSDKSLCLVQAEQSSCKIISYSPIFSSIVNSAVDQRNGNIYSIINGNIHYLRKVIKGFEPKELQLIQQNIPFQIVNAFVNQKDIECKKQQLIIYLSSLNQSFVLQIFQSEGSQNLKLTSINSLFECINKNEIIKDMSFQENGRVLMILNSRIIIIDEQSKKIISEQKVQNDQKESEQVVKSTILENSWIFVLTQTNKVYAYKQDFINFKSYKVPSIIQDSDIILNQKEQSIYSLPKGSTDNNHSNQTLISNYIQIHHNKQMLFMNKQISALYIYKQSDEIHLIVGYYNKTIKIIRVTLEDNALNMKTVQHFYTQSILNDVLFYNNSETQGLIFTYRNGTIQDLIQLDYSKDIKDQEEIVKTIHLDDRDSAKIFKFDNKIYFQSSHAIYYYKQSGINTEPLYLVLHNNKYFLNDPIINFMLPVSKDQFILISQDNWYSFKQQANLVQEKSEFKQVLIPLKTADKILQQKLQINNQNSFKKQIMNCYFFKRILFNRELDAFLIIDQMGCIYIVSRNGYILQVIDNLPSLYPMMKVANMKKVMISDKDQHIFIATEKHGALLIQLQFESNKVAQDNLNINQNQRKRVSKLQVINQFILQNQQQQDIYFVSDVTYMSLLNLLFICGQNFIFCYELQKEIESTSEEEKFQFNKISQLILPQKQIICLDSINNLILIGDLKDSVLLYNIQHKFEGGKHFFQWNLEKTEFNQRALKESVFVDKSNLLGLDKYGEIFGSVTDQKVYHDANFNLHNFSLMNLRETGQIIKFHRYIKTQKYINHQEAKNNQIQESESCKLLPKLHNMNRQTLFYVCGIGGSIYQVVYCDLLFSFDIEKYNSYILILENILRQLKSNYSSQKKNSLDLMRKTRKFGNCQRFIDINLFESLNKQEFYQIVQDLQNQLSKEEVQQLSVEELKKVFQYMFSLFMN